ncbi:HEAT repeat domain-containing protein [Leptodesmis sichuanensis]|uniref:HEAT repeat domain-containing protein n=1 Tax=Leptodesmis sichuanensis TaxID=2906798 RepID=UPI001F46C2AA|nr:HEAT repeat domain-containing protein [Leptodesmis sichuanensis]UIE36679.1 HEAT repeat domain-containing protein [Leptodesmis sichuanensis A121]
MISALDVQPYLQAILSPARNRQDWQDFYTSTQAQLPLRVRAYASAQSDPEASQQEDKLKQMEVLAGLRKYAANHVLLIGNPGSGKSTALRRLLWEEAERCTQAKREQKPIVQIPVLVELRSYRNGSVLDWLKKELRSLKLSLSQEEIQCFLDSQGLLLLFDGLNELPSRESWQEVDSFRKRNLGTPMIFTTRKLEAGADLGIEKKLEMMPLCESQMRQFIERRLKGQADELLRGLGDRLQDLAETPLLLKMLCEVFTPEQPVPQNRGGLFRMFVRRYDEEHKPRCQYEANAFPNFFKFRDEVMQLLAVEMIQGGEPPTDALLQIDKNQAEELIETSLRRRGETDSATKAKNWLEDLIEHHLLQLAANSRQIEFHHQLFQEYYAAEWLLLRLKPNHPEHISNEQLKYYLNYLKWTEAIALMLNLMEDKDQAVQAVQLALEVDLMLGARLAGEVDLKFQEQTINLVAALKVPEKPRTSFFRSHSEKNSRLLITELLGITHSEYAILELSKALEDSDPRVRRSAVSALGQLRSEKAIPALLKALENQDAFIDMSIEVALRNLNSKIVVPELLKALEDPKFCGRQKVVFILGGLGSDIAVPGLIKALEDQDSNVRWRAAFSLKRLHSEKAIPALLKALEDKSPIVRKNAAEALGEIVLGKVDTKVVVPSLLKALQDRNYQVRMETAKALGKIGDEVAIPALLAALEDLLSPVRSSAAEALGEIGSQIAIPALLTASEDQDIFVRCSVESALRKLRKEEPFLVLPSLEAIDEEIKKLGVQPRPTQNRQTQKTEVQNFDSLSDIETSQELGEAAIPMLLKALKSKDPYIGMRAATKLGEIGNKEVIPGLLKVLEDEDFFIRGNAAAALERLSSEATIPTLLKALKHPNAGVREGAARVLEKLGHPALLPHVWQMQLSNSELVFISSLLGTIQPLLFSTIKAIQERCKFYNYDITKSPPPPSAAVWKIQELLTQLAQTYPTTTKSEQQIFLDQFDERIRPTPHIASILVEGGIEGIKLLCPPAGIPIEMARKLYEILMKNRER